MGGVGAMNPMVTAASNMGSVGDANMGIEGSGGVCAMQLPIGDGCWGGGYRRYGFCRRCGGYECCDGCCGRRWMGMGMGTRQVKGMMGGVGRARPGMNQGPGPARVTPTVSPVRSPSSIDVRWFHMFATVIFCCRSHAFFFIVTTITELLSASSIIVSFVCLSVRLPFFRNCERFDIFLTTSKTIT